MIKKRKFKLLKRSAFVLSIALATSVSTNIAFAHVEDQGKTFSESLSQSEFTFYGRVKNIDYKLSKEGIPHTFVSYEVFEKIRGGVKSPSNGRESNQESITLRFVGGPKENGTFLDVSSVPHFNVGDKDILMVKENGSSGCPLVLCQNTRFRVTDKGIYSANGTPLTAINKGQPVFDGDHDMSLLSYSYPAPTFDQLLKTKEVQNRIEKMGGERMLPELRKKFEANAPKTVVFQDDIHNDENYDLDTSTTGEIEDKNESSKQTLISLDVFLTRLIKFASTLKDSDNYALNTSPSVEFSTPASKVAPPITPSTNPKEAISTNKRDLEELKISAEQNNDPVIWKNSKLR